MIQMLKLKFILIFKSWMRNIYCQVYTKSLPMWKKGLNHNSIFVSRATHHEDVCCACQIANSFSNTTCPDYILTKYAETGAQKSHSETGHCGRSVELLRDFDEKKSDRTHTASHEKQVHGRSFKQEKKVNSFKDIFCSKRF